uniref:Uncharacterized protein n=1 Tax=Anguilla anguilla TaxID=7936 RepID=A0A0E9W9A9_ANGAN
MTQWCLTHRISSHLVDQSLCNSSYPFNCNAVLFDLISPVSNNRLTTLIKQFRQTMKNQHPQVQNHLFFL